MKEKYLLLNQPEKIRDICSEISNLKQFRFNPNIRIDVARSLDSEYKHEQRRTAEYDRNVTDATNSTEKALDEYAEQILTELLETTNPYDRSVRANQRAADLAEKFLIKQEE